MSYASREESTYEGAPWEAFWFSTTLQNFRYTSGDTARTVLGQTYESLAIRCPDDLEQGEELSAQTLTVEIPLDCALADLMRDYLPPRPVSLVIYRGHDGEAEHVVAYTGQVASAKRSEICELTVEPQRKALGRQLPGAAVQVQCIRRVGSPRCGVDLTALMVVATLASVDGRTITSPAFAAKPDGYFKAGWIEALGTAMAISSHVGSTLTLVYPLPGLAAGAQVVAYPGCQGTEAECASKFNNLPNHLGFARVPSVNPFGEGGI